MSIDTDELRRIWQGLEVHPGAGFDLEDIALMSSAAAEIDDLRKRLSEEEGAVPKFFLLALCAVQDAFEERATGKLSTINEHLQGPVDAAMSWVFELRTSNTDLRGIIDRAVEASDKTNTKSASDTVQDMLEILEEAFD